MFPKALDYYPDRNTCCRNFSISVASAVLFSIGWWIFIDAVVQYKEIYNEVPVALIPGFVGTVSFVIVQITPYKEQNQTYFRCCRCSLRFMIFVLFIAFVMMFSSVIWASYVLAVDFILTKNRSVAPGVLILFQNLFIMSANILYKFGKKNLAYMF